MALKIMRAGIPLDQLYGAKGPSTAATTGCMQAGVDVNQSILALADGKALGFNSGCVSNSRDFSSLFGQPTGNTPLPINGQTFTSTATSGTGPCSSSLIFSANNSTWTVSGNAAPNGSVPTPQSGAIPAGSTSIQMTLTLNTSNGSGSTTNGAASQTALTATNVSASVSASGTPSTVEGQRWATLTINFYNSSNVIISTSNIAIRANAIGTS